MATPLDILHEDNHLLVVNKPANLATQGAAAGQPSLAELAKQYLKEKYNKPGNVYVGVVSRLDAMTTGVIVLARTSKAASRLSEQFRARAVKKSYWAVAPNQLDGDSSGALTDHICKNESQHRMAICEASHPEAQLATMTYRQLRTLPNDLQLLEIELETGRKHQIRVQLSHRNCPIVGDRKYDSPIRFGGNSDGIALHSRELVIVHPTTKETLKFTAPLPASWKTLGVS